MSPSKGRSNAPAPFANNLTMGFASRDMARESSTKCGNGGPGCEGFWCFLDCLFLLDWLVIVVVVVDVIVIDSGSGIGGRRCSWQKMELLEQGRMVVEWTGVVFNDGETAEVVVSSVQAVREKRSVGRSKDLTPSS